MGISLDSLSITSAFNSIVNFFKSQENNSRWKDLTTGAEGTFLIRMLANILSNISYRLVTARRENYLSTANLKSSVLGIALNLGYSASRGINQKRKIRFEPNSDYVIPAFTAIGSYNDDYDVIYIGEKNPNTHLRSGLILQGTYKVGIVKAINALTKSITAYADINDVTIGDTIEISGSVSISGDGSADGRYTVESVTRKNENDIVIRTVEDIPYTCSGSQDCIVTRINTQDFKTVIGKIKTISWTAGTNKTKLFTRFEENISDDYILYLDGKEVPSSDYVGDLNNDCYLVRTNPYSSVDVLYLNHLSTNTHRYGSESVFTLKYIELADVPSEDYAPNMSGYGTVINTLTIDNFVDFEDIETIKINAPINHELQHLIRSKNDFAQSIVKQYPNVLETAYQAITPTYTLLTYLKDDSTTLKQSEVDSLNAILDKEKYFGTPNPDVSIPIREATNLVIEVFISDKFKDSNDVRYDISNIIKTNYSRGLAQKIDTYTLERLIEQLSYIKWARVSFDISEWAQRVVTDLGTVIYANNTYYKAGKVLGVSGGTSPSWNVPVDEEPVGIDLDDVYETKDGAVIWRTYKKLDVQNISEYKTSTKYALGDYVYDLAYPNFMFKCVDFIKNSGAVSTLDTTATQLGDFLVDGGLILVNKEYSSYYPARQPNTVYRLGDSFNVDDKSFEVVSFIGTTGYISPSFEKAFYEIKDFITPNVVLDYKLNDHGYFQVAGDQTPYFISRTTFGATKDKSTIKKSFTVKNSVYDPLKDRTTIYTNEEIDLLQAQIVGAVSDVTTSSSTFKLEGDFRDYFKIGDYIRGYGYLNAVLTYETFNVIEVTKSGEYTLVKVRGILPSKIIFAGEGSVLVVAGYTSLYSSVNNSFVLEGDKSAFFRPADLIKVQTEENAKITYAVESATYQNAYDQTFVTVKQEITSNNNYSKLAPTWVGTEDGEILWEIIEDPTEIQYNWNVYNDINYKLNIKRQ